MWAGRDVTQGGLPALGGRAGASDDEGQVRAGGRAFRRPRHLHHVVRAPQSAGEAEHEAGRVGRHVRRAAPGTHASFIIIIIIMIIIIIIIFVYL